MKMGPVIQTATGPISPTDLGVVLPHEHLSMTFEKVAYTPADLPAGKEPPTEFTLADLGWIRQYPYAHKPNLHLHEANEEVLQEMKEFKAAGGGTVVDNTTLGINRDIEFASRVTKETGVNVVLGTGFYVDAALPPHVANMTVESMAEHMRTELEEGCEGTEVRCGVMGELGCSWPLTATEKKALQAAGLVQSGASSSSRVPPAIIHPGRHRDSPFEILRIFQEAGGFAGRTVMSHLDRTLLRDEDILEFADLGSYCEYDLFGTECSHYQLLPSLDMPSDAERIRRIKLLIENGFGEKITIAHDIHTKHRLKAFGGHGFSHILENVVPMMKVRGISGENIDRMLVKNPKSWLTF